MRRTNPQEGTLHRHGIPISNRIPCQVLAPPPPSCSELLMRCPPTSSITRPTPPLLLFTSFLPPICCRLMMHTLSTRWWRPPHCLAVLTSHYVIVFLLPSRTALVSMHVPKYSQCRHTHTPNDLHPHIRVWNTCSHSHHNVRTGCVEQPLPLSPLAPGQHAPPHPPTHTPHPADPAYPRPTPNARPPPPRIPPPPPPPPHTHTLLFWESCPLPLSPCPDPPPPKSGSTFIMLSATDALSRASPGSFPLPVWEPAPPPPCAFGSLPPSPCPPPPQQQEALTS